MRNLMIAAGLLASLTAARGALAQDAAPPAAGSGSASSSTSGQANVGVSLPGATAAAAATGSSDHNQMVGHFAVGYFGIANTGAGMNAAGGPNDSPYLIQGVAPVVGVRYWLDQMIGLDVGLGLSVIGGSIKSPDPVARVDRGSFTGFLIHGGVPLALASTDHFAFEIIPELNLGFASAHADNNGATAGDQSYSGFHIDLGARAGAEVSFGFMKLPQLSLVGSVGLRFDSDSGKTNDTVVPMGANAPVGKSSSSRSEFHTTVGSNPWAIFTNQVAALYYF
jgi:hypothetical protein